MRSRSKAAGRGTPARLWVLAACFLFLLVSCSPKQDLLPAAGDRWQAHDLRALEDPESHAIVAAYARQTQTDVEVRLDLLELPSPADIRLLLALDTGPGGAGLSFAPEAGTGWDLLVSASIEHRPSIIGLNRHLPQDFRARVVHDIPDSIIVRLPRRFFTQNLNLPGENDLRFIAFITPSQATEVQDTLGPFLFAAAPPPQAPLLLAFWDTLPSATPAQALRRWDGAHTGPYGQRHGLSILLKAARRYNIPVALLDLKRPQQLSVLPLLGGLEQVQAMKKDGLAILPDPIYRERSDDSEQPYQLDSTRQINTDSSLVYGILDQQFQGQPAAAFAWLDDPTHIMEWNGTRLIPLPQNTEEEGINEYGLTTQLRVRLLQTALSADLDDVVVLGGSLPRSPWGDLINVGPAMNYITNHPWIKVLNESALLAMPARSGQPRCADLLCMPEPPLRSSQEALRLALDQSPPGLFTGLAWQTYLNLTEPKTDERLAALQSIYLGDAAYLVRAAQWAAEPMNLSTCSQDLDFDGSPECLLASQRIFLIFSPLGGRLVFAAAMTESGPVQLIGPRSQLAVGLGDARDWNLDNGLAADPQEITGAFADTGPFLAYQVDLQPTAITLTRPDTGLQKRFLLDLDGFQVEINNPSPVDIRLPLILLDSGFSQPGWLARYQAADPSPAAWAWGLKEGSCIRLSTTGAEMAVSSFIESRSLMQESENPDLAYPPGHFLPFPMAVVDLHSEGNFKLTLKVTPFQENFAGFSFGRSCVHQP